MVRKLMLKFGYAHNEDAFYTWSLTAKSYFTKYLQNSEKTLIRVLRRCVKLKSKHVVNVLSWP